MLNSIEYKNRSPQNIITQNVYFDSSGYTYRALSWLDFAKKERNVCAFQYSAHDIRQAIEQLFFEEIVRCVGTKLDDREYKKCKGSSTKLHKIINRLNPDYQKLVQFIQAVFSINSKAPPIISFDHKELLKHWGKVSNYLHWIGAAPETFDSQDWLDNGFKIVEAAAQYIWQKKKSGYSGIMMPKDMQPEIKEYWEKYRDGIVDIDAVKRVAKLSLPILEKRLNK